jgi:hypothetical protein
LAAERQPPVPAGEIGARAERIHRGLRDRQDLLRRYRWEAWGLGECSFLVSLLLSVPLLLIEPALLLGHPVPPPLAPLPDRLALLLLLLLPVHGLLLERILAAGNQPAAAPAVPAGWLRGCRFLLSSVPVLGLFVLPLWRRLVAAGPSWAFRGEPAARPLDLRRLAQVRVVSRAAGAPAAAGGRTCGPRPLRRPRVAGLPAAAALMAITVALPLVWAAWLGGSVARGDGHYRIAAVAVCAALHLAVAACATHYFRGLRRGAALPGWRGSAWRWLPLLSLVPLAGVLLGIWLLEDLEGGAGSLVRTAYDRRWSAGRLPLWPEIEETLRQRWRGNPWWRRFLRPTGLEHPATAGRAEKGLLALHRYKGLATFFDGVALAWALALLAQRGPARAPAVASILRALWLGSLALASAGLAERGLLLGSRLARATDLVERLDRHPYGRALLVPYSALAAGVISGQLLAGGRDKDLTMWLSLVAALGIMVGALVLMLQSVLPGGRTLRVESRDTLPRTLFLLALLLGEMVLALSGGAHRVASGLAVAAALSPLGSALCGLVWGRWLLSPFGWEDLLSGGLRPGLRGLLAALAASTVLPLGGLAAPLWVLARQWVWPRAMADAGSA